MDVIYNENIVFLNLGSCTGAFAGTCCGGLDGAAVTGNEGRSNSGSSLGSSIGAFRSGLSSSWFSSTKECFNFLSEGEIIDNWNWHSQSSVNASLKCHFSIQLYPSINSYLLLPRFAPFFKPYSIPQMNDHPIKKSPFHPPLFPA